MDPGSYSQPSWAPGFYTYSYYQGPYRQYGGGPAVAGSPFGGSVIPADDWGGATAANASTASSSSTASTAAAASSPSTTSAAAVDAAFASWSAQGSAAFPGMSPSGGQSSQAGRPYLAEAEAPSNPVGTFAPSVPNSTPSYNAAGQLTGITDPLGNTTSFGYDGQGNVASITDANGGVTQFTYSPTNQLASLTDPDGNTTTWQYNSLGQVTQQTNALGATRSYSYSPVGQLIQQVGGTGEVRQFVYDAQGRVTSESWYNSLADAEAGQNATNVIEYQYDPAGELLCEWDNSSSEVYTYDPLGRETSVTQTSLGSPVVTLNYGYAGGSTLPTSTSAAINGTPDYQDLYQYNSQGQLVGIERSGQPGGDAVANVGVQFSYAPGGQFQSITRSLSGQVAVTANYGYDPAGNLTSLAYSQGTSTLAGYSYQYDADGRVIEATTPDGTVYYTYDADGELTGAYYGEAPATTDGTSGTDTSGGTSSSSVQPDETYSYDANGNRTNPGYVTGLDNELLSDGTYNYKYDAQGNRIERASIADGSMTDYAWDARNRLVSVTDESASGQVTQKVSYVYDPQNRLVEETVDPNGDPTLAQSTYFVYSGNEIVLQFQAAAGAKPALTHRYLWGPAVDQIFADEQFSPLPLGEGQGEGGTGQGQVSLPTQSGNVILPLTDNLGTVRDLAQYDPTTQTTTIDTHRTYSAFGQLLSQTNPTTLQPAAVDCVFGFTGRLFDQATGLQNNLNRWYDPGTGRWVSKDPSGFTGGGDANLYRYCGNDPTTSTDPTGLDSQSPGGFWWGLYVGASRIGQSMWAPFRAMGVTKWVGLESKLQESDAALEGARSEIIQRGSLTDGVWDLSANEAAVATQTLLLMPGAAKPATALARELGTAGEDAAGIVKNTTRIESLSGAKAYRIPDGLTQTTLTEVKNVAKLDFSLQLRDSRHYAMMTGRKFVLVVRKDTVLSQPLIDAINAGYIIIRYLP